MSSCIVFSATILSDDREFVIRRFLQSFKERFSDSDLYIGINPGSIPSLESIIGEYDLNVQVTRVDASLYNFSDASAYQAALKLLYQSGKRYDNYWFVHTKSGVNNHSDYLREWYIDNFISRRQDIELFMQEERVGSYGMLGLEYDLNRIFEDTDVEISLWKNDISEDLPYTHANFFYIHTIYALAAGPMDIFFKLVNDNWFNSKLDRYYFEGVFPFIVSRAGYFPYLENGISTSGVSLLSYQSQWVTSNQLQTQYNHLINRFKTNYPFFQLHPPYVNSNT